MHSKWIARENTGVEGNCVRHSAEIHPCTWGFGFGLTMELWAFVESDDESDNANVHNVTLHAVGFITFPPF